MIIEDQKLLRRKSEDLDDAYDSLEDMVSLLETALASSRVRGAGLSGIQIGIPIRVAIIRTDTLKLDLYNARITSGSKVITFKGEGCLSIPNTYVHTKRMNNITVENGDGQTYDLEGFDAVVVQHELDHWDGILMLDRRI